MSDVLPRSPRPKVPRNDAAAIIVALIAGVLVGSLIAHAPTIYTLAWWIGAPSATLIAGQFARRIVLLFPLALLANLALAAAFWLEGGVPALTLRVYHTTHLEGAALRGLLSDLLSTALLACFASLMAALMVRNGRLVEIRSEGRMNSR